MIHAQQVKSGLYADIASSTVDDQEQKSVALVGSERTIVSVRSQALRLLTNCQQQKSLLHSFKFSETRGSRIRRNACCRRTRLL
jgi:hypothetical protein